MHVGHMHRLRSRGPIFDLRETKPTSIGHIDRSVQCAQHRSAVHCSRFVPDCTRLANMAADGQFTRDIAEQINLFGLSQFDGKTQFFEDGSHVLPQVHFHMTYRSWR